MTNQIDTLFVDMDGVIADFKNTYDPFKEYVESVFGSMNNRKIFTAAITFGIYEKLGYMSNGMRLVREIENIRRDHGKLKIKILSATGTANISHLTGDVQQQKRRWLNRNGINWDPVFVLRKVDKATVATRTSVLLDDRPGCTDPFIAKGGHAVLYKNETIDTHVKELRDIILGE